MNVLVEYKNDTVSLCHIIMPLISLMSTHFFINSFTLLSNMETTSTIMFVKSASKFYLSINSHKSAGDNGTAAEDRNKGYLIVGNDYNFSKVIHAEAKFVVAVYTMNDKDPRVSKFLSELVIPPSTTFFVIPLVDTSTYFSSGGSSNIKVQCLRLYKPISGLPLKAIPTLFYGGRSKPQWIWENNKRNWNSFSQETRDMKGVTIKIALLSHSTEGKKAAMQTFWNGKDAFFWSVMQDHLRFRSVILFKKVLPGETKNMSILYESLFRAGADGMSVLPVISGERAEHLDFVLTGIDTRNHLLVRTPQYVHSWRSIFKPLEFDSWVCLAIAVLLVSITLRIVVTCEEKSEATDFSSCFLIIFGFICSQGSSNIPKSLSGCVVCYTALLFSILISQFYTSNLYSLLSTKEVSLPFTTLEEVIALGTYNLYVHPDTAIYRDLTNAKNGIFKEVWDTIKNNPSHKLKSGYSKKALDKVCAGKGAILGLPFQTKFMKDLSCELVPVNSGYCPANTVTMLRKHFPFRSQFQFVHTRLIEAGMSHRFRDTYFTVNQQHKTKADVINEPITLVHVAFLFVLLATSVILSWLILSLEIMASKNMKSKKGRRMSITQWAFVGF